MPKIYKHIYGSKECKHFMRYTLGDTEQHGCISEKAFVEHRFFVIIEDEGRAKCWRYAPLIPLSNGACPWYIICKSKRD